MQVEKDKWFNFKLNGEDNYQKSSPSNIIVEDMKYRRIKFYSFLLFTNKNITLRSMEQELFPESPNIR